MRRDFELGERLASLEADHRACARDLGDLRAALREHFAWDEATHRELAHELREELRRVADGLEAMRAVTLPAAWRNMIPAAIGAILSGATILALGRLLVAH